MSPLAGDAFMYVALQIPGGAWVPVKSTGQGELRDDDRGQTLSPAAGSPPSERGQLPPPSSYAPRDGDACSRVHNVGFAIAGRRRAASIRTGIEWARPYARPHLSPSGWRGFRTARPSERHLLKCLTANGPVGSSPPYPITGFYISRGSQLGAPNASNRRHASPPLWR